MPHTFANHPAYRLVNSRYRVHQTKPLDLAAANSVPAGRSHTSAPANTYLPRQVPNQSMRSNVLSRAGGPNGDIARLNRIATEAAINTAFALAADRSRAEAEEAKTTAERESAEWWIARWGLATADQVHPDDFAQLERDLEHQIQWALAHVDGIYAPNLSRYFIDDYQRLGRHAALARAHHPEAYDWVEPESRRKELLRQAWSYSPIEPFIDEYGDIRLFNSVAEQRVAERERDQVASAPEPEVGARPLTPSPRRRLSVISRFWRRI